MGRLNFDNVLALDVPTQDATDVSKQVASTEFVQNVVPPAVVFPYAGPIPPDGWLLADGSAVSRTLYPRLFAAIGTTYGEGDGTTTFNLPELRGEFIRGLDNARGVDAGRGLGTAQADDFKEHNHTYNTTGHASGNSALTYLGLATGQVSRSVSNTGGSETRPRNVAMNYIIKAQ